MRKPPKPRFAKIPLKKIEHLMVERNAVVIPRKVTRDKGAKLEPYHSHAVSSKPTGFWGSFHS